MQITEELLKTISAEFTWMLIQFFIVFVFIGIAKNIIDSVIDYIKIRFSPWGIGTKVGINGSVGTIESINFNYVNIEIENKINAYVPVKNFLKMNKTIYKNGKKK